MLNVHQLNVFTVAAETLNFTQTAKRLHLTQSSVSQHIKALESHLETDLFIRRGRSLELTDAARFFLPMARDIVEDSIRAEEKMQLLKQRVYGSLVIGCNTAPGKYVLPVILAEFHKLHPLVQITCKVLSQDEATDKLADGEVQFALTQIDEEQRQHADYHPYIREPIILIAPSDHPWASREFIYPEELYDENFIMREDSSGTYSSVREGLERVGVNITKLSAFLVMGTYEAIALAVQEGLGVGFVSQMIVSKICHNRVATIQVRGLEMCQEIYFGRQVRLPATSAQAAFWEFVEMEREPYSRGSQSLLSRQPRWGKSSF
jgi:DNA-binding transcriptional LysR family regulator